MSTRRQESNKNKTELDSYCGCNTCTEVRYTEKLNSELMAVVFFSLRATDEEATGVEEEKRRR